MDPFTRLTPISAPKALAESVLLRVARFERRISRFKLFVFALGALVSFGSLFPATRIIFAEAEQSGFSTYFSLITSDGAAVAYAWRAFLPTLIESLPLLGLTAFLSALFVLLGSLKYAVKQLRTL